MKKIQTIFDRDWKGNRGVIDKLIVDFDFSKAKATEKVDGTNIRITVRNKNLVRVEKRCNPSKRQKAMGIEEPWYVDADANDPQDKWIFNAVADRTLEDVPDGEWSAEAFGKNIQGNPLGMDRNTMMIFSLDEAPVFDDCPNTYGELKEWLPSQHSKIGIGIIEGIVWHGENGKMVKIKNKDFKS